MSSQRGGRGGGGGGGGGGGRGRGRGGGAGRGKEFTPSKARAGEEEFPSLGAVAQQLPRVEEPRMRPQSSASTISTVSEIEQAMLSGPQSPVQPPPVKPAWGAPKQTSPELAAPKQQPIGKEAEKPATSQPSAATASAIPQQSTLTSVPTEEFPKAKGAVEEMSLIPKPKQRGTIGRPIRLVTNHYKLKLGKLSVVQYDVSIARISDDPKKSEKDRDLKEKELVKDLFKNFDASLPPKFKNRKAYNFSKNMFFLDELPTTTFEAKAENNDYRITFEKINVMQIDTSNMTQPETIQLLNIISTHSLSLAHPNAARSFFTSPLYEMGLGVRAWKGAYASVRPSECGLTMNIDNAIALFYSVENVLDLACKFYECNPPQLANNIKNDRDGQLIGVSFLAMIKGRDVKVKTTGFRKKIDRFGSDCSYKFEWRKPDNSVQMVTIKEYLQKQYNYTVKYPDIPCIVLPRDNMVPMELCLTEQRQKKKLSDTEITDIRKDSVLEAPKRMERIQEWANTCALAKDPILKEFNIDVDLKNMVQLTGRVIPAPDVQYAKQQFVTSNVIGEKGAWDHRNKVFYQTQMRPLKTWIIINLANVKEDQLYRFVDLMINVGKIHGMGQINDPSDVLYYNPTGKSEQKLVNDIGNMFGSAVKKFGSLDLVVAFVNDSNPGYKTIKTCGDLKSGYGVPTQCVTSRIVFKMNEQVMSNILLKINSKLGGTNFVLSRANNLFGQYLKSFFDKPIMIFGADVTHPSPGDSQSESIAAVTASMDFNCAYYVARIIAQRDQKNKNKQAQEIILDLDKVFVNLILEFKEKNKNMLPARIVFYRDGVSEGQFKHVLWYEINRIRAACTKILPGYQPAITFVIVQKRHHTRFMPMDFKDRNGRGNNVPPGTVVDKDVVTPDQYDYFLCSHAGIQGTSRPCRYFVLHDENNFTMDQIQLLSHYLCHIYSRTARSVSYPAPAYYAHLAAFRGREYIRQTEAKNSYEIEIHEKMRNTMFYT